jgi:hypothetical protein
MGLSDLPLASAEKHAACFRAAGITQEQYIKKFCE